MKREVLIAFRFRSQTNPPNGGFVFLMSLIKTPEWRVKGESWAIQRLGKRRKYGLSFELKSPFVHKSFEKIG
jgi:hypothetical protein